MVNHRTADVLVRERAALGEVPRWSVALQSLLWLDIDGGLLHVTEPDSGRDATHDVGPGMGLVAPRADGGVALARRDALVVAPLDGAPERPLASIPSAPDEVMNEGACDPAGRLWAGTYAAGERPGGGRLYRLDPDGAVRTVLRSVTLSNGLGWSPDHRTMYYVDSATQAIDTFTYDVASGTIADRRPWVRIAKEDGLPDGLAVDHDGAVWVALWGGRAVRRYAPDGRLDRVVDVPADHVTACAFGGRDGATLFITTAAGYLEPAARAAQPLAGSLFALDPGVSGPPPHLLP